MEKKRTVVIIAIASFFFPVFSSHAVEQKLIERLDSSAAAFEQLMESADSGIPEDLLSKCEAVVIFPGTLNLAWGLGGQYGKGVAIRHDKKTGQWGRPAFYTIGGLTIGPQIGGQAIDIVLVVMNEKGLNSLLQSKTTLGGDAGIAVGPAGRNATVSTDLGLKAEMYSYSRARGLYIGLSLKGAVVAPDKEAIAQYYGSDLTAREILLEHKGGYKRYEGSLVKTLRRYSPSKALSLPLFIAILLVILLVLFAFFRRHKPA